MTRESAIALLNTKWWEGLPDRDVVGFQLFEPRLCMPWDKFQETVQRVLGRPVWTHEFAFVDGLKKEFLGDKPAPTFEEIINLIPEEKRIIINFDDSEESHG